MKRMLTIIIGIAVTALIAAAGVSAQQPKQGAATPARELAGRQYSKGARVGLEDARNIAQKAYAGVIASEELEPEPGGSGLRYSFDIRKDGITREVGVDAMTGKVLENSLEGPGAD